MNPKLNAGLPIVFPDGTMQPPFRDYLLRASDWSSITNTPTTLAGYGITDAYTKDETDALRPNPNLVIDGNFQIEQSGTGTRAPGTGVYGFDMWKGHANGLEQVIEYTGPAATMTLSWEGGGTGTLNGTSGSSPITATVSASTNFSVIVPDDAEFVKCEHGSVATPFLAPFVGDELARAQRYYFDTGNKGIPLLNRGSPVSQIGTNIHFPVSMRTTPSLSVSLNTNTAIIFGAGVNGAYVYVNTATSTSTQINSYIADARL